MNPAPNPGESPGATVRAVTPEGYRELRDFKWDVENSDSDGEDVLSALTSFNDHDVSFVISLNTVSNSIVSNTCPNGIMRISEYFYYELIFRSCHYLFLFHFAKIVSQIFVHLFKVYD